MDDQNHQDFEFLEKQVENNPDSLLFARLADFYLEQGEVDKAADLCESGLKKHPSYVTGHFVLGKCYFKKREFERAEKEFKRVLLLDPKFLAAHKYYGDVMREIGWENTCAMSYKKITQIDPLDEVAKKLAAEFQEVEEPVQKRTEPRIEMDTVAPIPVSPEEEDLLFEEETEEPPEKKVEPEIKIDQEKEEEYSTILDEIFKEDVQETESAPDETPEQVEVESKPAAARHEKTREADTSPESDKPEQKQQDDEPAFDASAFAPEPKPEKESGSEQEQELHRAVQNNKSADKKASRGKIVTPTLGEIYAAQGQYSKAIEVFETLLKKHPDNEFYSTKISELKKKLAESKDAS